VPTSWSSVCWTGKKNVCRLFHDEKITTPYSGIKKNLCLLSSGVLVPANRLKINLIKPLEYRIKRIIAPNYQKQVIFSGSLDGMI
jgi:hypothetical protein